MRVCVCRKQDRAEHSSGCPSLLPWDSSVHAHQSCYSSAASQESWPIVPVWISNLFFILLTSLSPHPLFLSLFYQHHHSFHLLLSHTHTHSCSASVAHCSLFLPFHFQPLIHPFSLSLLSSLGCRRFKVIKRHGCKDCIIKTSFLDVSVAVFCSIQLIS